MNQIEQKAAELRARVGGSIFAFPIDEEDPLSKYAVVMYTGKEYRAYPEAMHVSEASAGILLIIEALEKEGFDFDYDRDVRLIAYQNQLDAPDVAMRRLKRECESPRILKDKEDIVESEGETYVTPRGMLKLNYLMMVDEKNPKAIIAMKKYYELLAIRKYGKTAAAIKQEVHRMDKQEASKWIERTYQRYTRDGDIKKILFT